MITVKVLGSGCANCKRLEQIARKVIQNLAIEAEVVKIMGSEPSDVSIDLSGELWMWIYVAIRPGSSCCTRLTRMPSLSAKYS